MKSASNSPFLPDAILRHHECVFEQALFNWNQTKTFPSALLITGIEGVGKRGFAHTLAQWAQCQQSATSAQALRPCGECSSCLKALHGTWVDFEEIALAKNETTIKIDQLRDLKGHLGFGAHESRYRIVLISGCEFLTPQAANSLLKVLEEPPPQWVFILTASDRSLVLPTLVSRCQVFRLEPIPRSVLAQALPEASPQVLDMAHGSWARAQELLDEASPERSPLLDRWDNPQLIDWASQDDKNLRALLNRMESECARELRGSLSKAKSRALWLDRAAQIAEARLRLGAPINRKILVQDLLLGMAPPSQ